MIGEKTKKHITIAANIQFKSKNLSKIKKKQTYKPGSVPTFVVLVIYLR
jgi:hypothetical protein